MQPVSTYNLESAGTDENSVKRLLIEQKTRCSARVQSTAKTHIVFIPVTPIVRKSELYGSWSVQKRLEKCVWSSALSQGPKNFNLHSLNQAHRAFKKWNLYFSSQRQLSAILTSVVDCCKTRLLLIFCKESAPSSARTPEGFFPTLRYKSCRAFDCRFEGFITQSLFTCFNAEHGATFSLAKAASSVCTDNEVFQRVQAWSELCKQMRAQK